MWLDRVRFGPKQTLSMCVPARCLNMLTFLPALVLTPMARLHTPLHHHTFLSKWVTLLPMPGPFTT